jgi:hypothetical protein
MSKELGVKFSSVGLSAKKCTCCGGPLLCLDEGFGSARLENTTNTLFSFNSASDCHFDDDIAASVITVNPRARDCHVCAAEVIEVKKCNGQSGRQGRARGGFG